MVVILVRIPFEAWIAGRPAVGTKGASPAGRGRFFAGAQERQGP